VLNVRGVGVDRALSGSLVGGHRDVEGAVDDLEHGELVGLLDDVSVLGLALAFVAGVVGGCAVVEHGEGDPHTYRRKEPVTLRSVAPSVVTPIASSTVCS
jgi:hypothetical protein